jgi:hypothetical protein
MDVCGVCVCLPVSRRCGAAQAEAHRCGCRPVGWMCVAMGCDARDGPLRESEEGAGITSAGRSAALS